MNDKYYMFRKLCDFLNEFTDVTEANMSNLFGEMEINGTADNGTTITIKVIFKEEKTND